MGELIVAIIAFVIGYRWGRKRFHLHMIYWKGKAYAVKDRSFSLATRVIKLEKDVAEWQWLYLHLLRNLEEEWLQSIGEEVSDE